MNHTTMKDRSAGTLRRIVTTLLVSSTIGCYSYRAITPTTATPGTTVRVTINGEEAVRQQSTLGRLAQNLEGQVVTADNGQGLALAVPQPTGPSQRNTLSTVVNLPRQSILLIEEKRFSAPRTALVAAGSAAVTLAVFAIIEASASGPGDEGPPDNALVRLRLLRLPVR